MTKSYVAVLLVTAIAALGPDDAPGYEVTDENGDNTWIEKDAFEADFIDLGVLDGLEPHVKRLLAEKALLDRKIEALEAFQTTDTWDGLPLEEKARMSDQLKLMREYSGLLAGRTSGLTVPVVAATEPDPAPEDVVIDPQGEEEPEA